ncbi:hypothetical protein DM02DRAFT_557329 [Periconia macrospinosa]|uniref:Uncharacterized protein n=1 Tax=Periconia macrospinosa TaxID=97972 RepID=A0A2V1DZR7_9PLEO|nr:hypothetical protein DM02DRAFT_557329 [Periconia macrospinosa]
MFSTNLHHALQNSTPSLSRSSTIDSVSSAVERVQQLCSHLSRTNTLSSIVAQEPTDTRAQPSNSNDSSTTMEQSKTNTSPASNACKFCKRPSSCPDCHKQLDPPAKKTPNGDVVDIDGDIEDIYNQLGPAPSNLPPQHRDFRHELPPTPLGPFKFSVFLAGSIEMGKAVQWQPRMAQLLQHLPISVFNPRRGQWNHKITPEARDADFRAQVEWELNALHEASVICFFFDHATMSPVTMCELGLWAHSGKVVVCCDKRFWKGGNVHIVCERYGIPCVQDFSELQPMILAMLRRKGMMLDKKGDLTEDVKNADPTKLPDEKILVQAGLKEPRTV